MTEFCPVLQLRSQSDGHQRSLGRLNRKLQQLSRFMCDSDQLTSEQLKSTVEQLRALNHTVELLHTQVHTEFGCIIFYFLLYINIL